jgi:hypothetical protein
MRIPLHLIAFLVIAGSIAAGCGSSDSGQTSAATTGGAGTDTTQGSTTAPAGGTVQTCEADAIGVDEVRVTNLSCDKGVAVAAEWIATDSCAPPDGASRFACQVGPWRCVGAATDRGLGVFCTQPGRSIVFALPPDS